MPVSEGTDDGTLMLSILRDLQQRLGNVEKRLDKIDLRHDRVEHQLIVMSASLRTLELDRIGRDDVYRDVLERVRRIEQHLGF
jgi:hypothetical protein